MFLSKDAHKHRYTQMGLKRIPSHNVQFNGDPMAVLVWMCDCKKYYAFEYGTQRDMKDRLVEMRDNIKYREIIKT